LEVDDPADVARVALAEVRVDVVVKLLELAPERLDLLGRQAVEGVARSSASSGISPSGFEA
jgi:hypothetical protein